MDLTDIFACEICDSESIESFASWVSVVSTLGLLHFTMWSLIIVGILEIIWLVDNSRVQSFINFVVEVLQFFCLIKAILSVDFIFISFLLNLFLEFKLLFE